MSDQDRSTSGSNWASVETRPQAPPVTILASSCRLSDPQTTAKAKNLHLRNYFESQKVLWTKQRYHTVAILFQYQEEHNNSNIIDSSSLFISGIPLQVIMWRKISCPKLLLHTSDMYVKHSQYSASKTCNSSEQILFLWSDYKEDKDRNLEHCCLNGAEHFISNLVSITLHNMKTWICCKRCRDSKLHINLISNNLFFQMKLFPGDIVNLW